MTMLPLPKVDKNRSWGSQCQSCNGSCTGHYASELVDVTNQQSTRSVAHLPSTVLKELFSKADGKIEQESFIENASRQALLAPGDTKIWLEHLRTIVQNRKQGAAATRRAKRASAISASTPVVNDGSLCFCGKCGKQYAEETEESELWIACDLCEKWYCCQCENLNSPPETEIYTCTVCQSNSSSK